MLGQGRHKGQPQGSLLFEGGRIHARAVVPNLEHSPPVGLVVQVDVDLALAPGGVFEGVLESVGHEFVDDQAADQGLVEIRGRPLEVDTHRDGPGRAEGAGEVRGQGVEVGPDVQAGQIGRMVELLVDQGHGLDPPLAFLEFVRGVGIR